MIKMKRTYLLVLILFLSVSLSAQKDKQAREILDKTANALQQAGGIRATFGGTGNGTLLLKGNRFYLNSGGIQSWFDGTTQWSYLESSEEVNVSNPTSLLTKPTSRWTMRHSSLIKRNSQMPK